MVQTQLVNLKNFIKLPNIFWGQRQEDVVEFVRHPFKGKIPHGQFSLVYEDETAIYLIRDRLGLNKLFYVIDQNSKTIMVGNYLIELAQETNDKEKLSSVPAGHYVKINKTTLEREMTSYYDISEQVVVDKEFNLTNFQKKVKDTLTNGFHYLKENFQDSEYFVCLSGGLDSTLILNYAKRFLAERVKAVTFSYASGETIQKYGHVIVDPPQEIFKDKVLSEDFHRASRIAKLLDVPFVAVLIEKNLDRTQLDDVIAYGQDWRDFNVHCAWVNYHIAHHIRQYFSGISIIFLSGDLMNEFVADYTAVDYKGVIYYPQPRIPKERLRKFFVYGLDAGDREIGIFHSQNTCMVQPFSLVAEIYLEVPSGYLEGRDAKQKLNSGLLFDQRLLEEVSKKKVRAQVGGQDGGTLGLFHDAGVTGKVLKERWDSLFALPKFIYAGRYRH